MTTSPKADDGPYVRFYIQNGVEVATCLAHDFRTAMFERDDLRVKNERLIQERDEWQQATLRAQSDFHEMAALASRLRAAMQEAKRLIAEELTPGLAYKELDKALEQN